MPKNSGKLSSVLRAEKTLTHVVGAARRKTANDFLGTARREHANNISRGAQRRKRLHVFSGTQCRGIFTCVFRRAAPRNFSQFFGAQRRGFFTCILGRAAPKNLHYVPARRGFSWDILLLLGDMRELRGKHGARSAPRGIIGAHPLAFLTPLWT